MTGKVWAALEPRNLELGPALHAESGRWSHWRLATDEEGIAWLVIDKKDASANTLDEEVLRELNEALGDIEADRPKGLVIRSGKANGFMVGADVGMFRGMTDPAAAEATIARANAVVDRLDALPVTTIAVVHGHCVGGGLEIALACDRRIAIQGVSLGFPEILLGLHPGLGGTARSVHLIDPVQAMTMALTGRPVDARRARSLGLVDALTEERHVGNAVRAAVAGELKPARRGLRAKLLATAPARGLAARRMRSKAAGKAPPRHYPAPNALIDLWERHGGDQAAMKRREQQSFAKLLATDTAQNLIRVFFLRNGLKEAARGEAGVAHVHVVGAGAMGGDIASWCAAQGLRVTLADLEARALGKAIGRAGALFGRTLKDRIKVRDALDRLTPDPGGEGVRHADLVIEAVPERVDLKRRVFEGLEPRMKAGAILATNTSSIPLETLSDGLERPERFVGLHFFNPVSRMQLVEVVRHSRVDAATMARATAFVGRIDRLPLEVKSAPGFLVNRALMAYLAEAIAMVEEGMAKETIDRAAVDFGMPMGPIELADQVGLDICVEVAAMLRAELDPSLPDVPDRLKKMVADGNLGRKTGQGYYKWKGGSPVKATAAAAPGQPVTDRLILPMVNACAACLREDIVKDADLLDGAMIFATGFAPFRGGPVNYARARGIDDVVKALKSLEGRHGKRFAPDKGWGALKRDARKKRDVPETV